MIEWMLKGTDEEYRGDDNDDDDEEEECRKSSVRLPSAVEQESKIVSEMTTTDRQEKRVSWLSRFSFNYNFCSSSQVRPFKSLGGGDDSRASDQADPEPTVAYVRKRLESRGHALDNELYLKKLQAQKRLEDRKAARKRVIASLNEGLSDAEDGSDSDGDKSSADELSKTLPTIVAASAIDGAEEERKHEFSVRKSFASLFGSISNPSQATATTATKPRASLIIKPIDVDDVSDDESSSGNSDDGHANAALPKPRPSIIIRPLAVDEASSSEEESIEKEEESVEKEEERERQQEDLSKGLWATAGTRRASVQMVSNIWEQAAKSHGNVDSDGSSDENHDEHDHTDLMSRIKAMGLGDLDEDEGFASARASVPAQGGASVQKKRSSLSTKKKATTTIVNKRRSQGKGGSMKSMQMGRGKK